MLPPQKTRLCLWSVNQYSFITAWQNAGQQTKR